MNCRNSSRTSSNVFLAGAEHFSVDLIRCHKGRERVKIMFSLQQRNYKCKKLYPLPTISVKGNRSQIQIIFFISSSLNLKTNLWEDGAWGGGGKGEVGGEGDVVVVYLLSRGDAYSVWLSNYSCRCRQQADHADHE